MYVASKIHTIIFTWRGKLILKIKSTSKWKRAQERNIDLVCTNHSHEIKSNWKRLTRKHDISINVYELFLDREISFRIKRHPERD